jgi:hypothetical protein
VRVSVAGDSQRRSVRGAPEERPSSRGAGVGHEERLFLELEQWSRRHWLSRAGPGLSARRHARLFLQTAPLPGAPPRVCAPQQRPPGGRDAGLRRSRLLRQVGHALFFYFDLSGAM